MPAEKVEDADKDSVTNITDLKLLLWHNEV
jgi:hypothetical protein